MSMVRRILSLFIISFLFSFFGPHSSVAETYYVDQGHASASDSHEGTDETLPWLTLDHATDVVVAGDTVVVKEGVYIDTDQTGTAEHDKTMKSFLPVNSGTPGNPITFISQPRLAAVIRSRDLEENNDYWAWSITDRDYIDIDGFKIEGGFIFGSVSRGCRHSTLKKL